MNWITKFIKPKIKSLFKKRPLKSDSNSLWSTCECKNLIYKDELFKNLSVCPKCGSHHKLTCKERFEIFFDNKDFTVLETPLPKDDPLKFNDVKKYTYRLEQARNLTKQTDAIQIAHGKLDGIEVTVGAQNFSFIGGSLGAASGEAFIHGVQHAINSKTPFIFFSCSGGARMMESGIALSNMTRTVIAVNELKKNNIPYIVVMTNPTAGGTTASFAGLGDIIIGEPKAIIAFAGARVIKDTVKEELPDGFQSAEFVKDHGGIDLVIERKYLRSTISTLISILLKKKETQAISTSDATTFKETLPKTSKAV
jgi:acetyl-CoA carboxylase carboxyl transferase subunit beta|tara:strand:- start:404 stop:1333 length:930 start_codon:yes stop_codon:yes gene_type:complete